MATSTWAPQTDSTPEGGGEVTISKRATPEEFNGQATTMKAIIQDRYGSADVLALRRLNEGRARGKIVITVRGADYRADEENTMKTSVQHTGIAGATGGAQ